MYNAVVVRPGEFMVRRGSPIRKYMFSRLVESIRRKLDRLGIGYDNIEPIGDSRIIVVNPEDPIETAIIASRIFGVSSTSPAIYLEDHGLNDLYGVVEDIVRERKYSSIALRIRGGLGSVDHRDILYAISSKLKHVLNISYNLSNPDATIIIENYGDKSIVSDQYIQGVGGLPYGVEGCLAVLVSGGVDSALAAWMTMKRGVRIVLIHIDYGEYWGVKAHRRVDSMIERILEWIPWDKLRVYRIRGYEKLVLNAPIPARLRCLFCKANMYRVAGFVARDEGCRGIATGEAVGQVASQTLSNLEALTRLSDTPVFRPIAFMDKLEIVEKARSLGFEELNISVEPCRLKPEHPATTVSSSDFDLLRKALEETRGEAYRIYHENREIIDLP